MLDLDKIKEYFGFGLDDGKTKSTRSRQIKVGMLALVILLTVSLFINNAASTNTDSTDNPTKKNAEVTGVVDLGVGKREEHSALEDMQRRLNEMYKTTKKNADSIKGLLVHRGKEVKQYSEIKARKIAQIRKITMEKQSGPYASRDAVGSKEIEMGRGDLGKTHTEPERMTQVQTFQFHYRESRIKKEPFNGSSGPKNDGKKRPKNYVPAGTFARVVLLEGADANASVNAQSDTSGILLRVLDKGTLPNGHHSHLKGCFVLASIYGDISSERGEVRLTKLSCTRSDGTIFEKSVQGYLSFAGKEGIKGNPVMRNGKILAMAGLSGMMSGFGSALQQATQTQSISPLGSTTTISPGRVGANAVYGGAGTAMSQLAGYYIKRADQYHPIIEIGSGTVATVIFQKGFSLIDTPPKEEVGHLTFDRKEERNQDDSEEVKSLLKEVQRSSSQKSRGDDLSELPFKSVSDTGD